MEKEAEGQIGTKVWTAKQIAHRYRYHTGKSEVGRNSGSKPKQRSVKDTAEEIFGEDEPEQRAPVEEVDPEQLKWRTILTNAMNMERILYETKLPVVGEYQEYSREVLRVLERISGFISIFDKDHDKQLRALDKIAEAAHYNHNRHGISIHPYIQKYLNEGYHPRKTDVKKGRT